MLRGSSSWDFAGEPNAPPDEGVAGGVDFDDLDDDWANMTPAGAGQEFVDMLMDLKTLGKLSARDVCVLSFFASKANCVGPASVFAFRPDAPTGHFQRHIDTIIPPKEVLKGRYTIKAPGHEKHTMTRATLNITVLPPHEVLDEEVRNNPGVVETLRASVAAGQWPRVYYEHRVVSRAPGDSIVWPVGLYVDGVPFQKRDGLIAFYVFSLHTGTRHLCATLRKSQLCRCGCLGWCSIWEVMSFLDWSFTALARGEMPTSRHDGREWQPDDVRRSTAAGNAIITAAVTQVKGDWSEFANTLGLYPWNANLHPCFCCTSTRDDLNKLGDFSDTRGPFEEKTPAQYEAACRICELVVVVPDAEVHAFIVGNLEYDKSRGGYRGRVLVCDVPAVGLLRGDRVEPSVWLRDVSKFEYQQPPFKVLFWRQSNQIFTHRRNPLFSPFTGISTLSLSLDTLHCLHLGVYQAFCLKVLWRLVLSDPWETRARNQEELIKLGVARCRLELFAWYAKQRRDNPTQRLQELQDLRPTMIGTPAHPSLSTKAAETGTLLGFCRDTARKYLPKLGAQGTFLVQVGDSLIAARDLMRRSPDVMDAAACEELCEHARRAFVLRPQAGIPFTPKWHLFLHICHYALARGNPRSYSTFVDEGFNGRLAKLAATCYKLTWYDRVLMNFRSAFSQGAKRARRGSAV